MNLISTLWFLLGSGSLIFAVDALIRVIMRSQSGPGRVERRLAWFGILMLAMSAGCIGIGVYEVLLIS